MIQVHFLDAAVGGCLIGISCVLMLWLNGRIAGISGIFHGIFLPSLKESVWRLLFLAGLLLGGIVGITFLRNSFNCRILIHELPILIGGCLVSIGTRLANGCTSGHGICGISRFSSRSLVATLTFMLTGMICVFIIRHLL